MSKKLSRSCLFSVHQFYTTDLDEDKLSFFISFSSSCWLIFNGVCSVLGSNLNQRMSFHYSPKSVKGLPLHACIFACALRVSNLCKRSSMLFAHKECTYLSRWGWLVNTCWVWFITFMFLLFTSLWLLIRSTVMVL